MIDASEWSGQERRRWALEMVLQHIGTGRIPFSDILLLASEFERFLFTGDIGPASDSAAASESAAS